MKSMDVDGLRIAYECVGDGAPLILLHGYVGDGEAAWRLQVDALADEFTVVVWDAPGAGGSSDPPESFGIAGYADCLASFIRGLDLDRPHVAGLSFGGIVALELSRRHPRSRRRWCLSPRTPGGLVHCPRRLPNGALSKRCRSPKPLRRTS